MCDGCIHYDACKALVVGLDGRDIDTVFFKGKCPNRRVAMTPEEFTKKMEERKHAYIDRFADNREKQDPEDCHWWMDLIMTDLLVSLGYKDGVDIFNRTEKWYA